MDIGDQRKPRCVSPGCTHARYCKGFCSKHYQRLRAHGDPAVVMQIRGDDRARILTKITVDAAGCWLWKRGLDKDGYGVMSFQGRHERAHRASYITFVGPIPEGLVIDHLCRIRHCVNPEHLEPVTNRENVLRGETIPAANILKTTCPKGHRFAGDNLYLVDGERRCRECARAASRRWKDTHRERNPQTMDIGSPLEIIEVEIPTFPEEQPAREPEPQREPEPVPA